MNEVILLITMQYCDDFQVHRFIKCLREWEAAKDQRSSRLQTTQGRNSLFCILSTYGTFPIRRFLSVVHFFFAKTSVVKPSETYITSNLLKSEKHQIKNFFLINSINSFLERDMLRTHCWSCFDVFVLHWQHRSLMSSKYTTEKNISSWFCLKHTNSKLNFII